MSSFSSWPIWQCFLVLVVALSMVHAHSVSFDSAHHHKKDNNSLDQREAMIYAILGSLCTSIAPALLVLAAPQVIPRRVTRLLLAFAAGGMLADAVLHMLPQILLNAAERAMHRERIVASEHHHHHHDHHEHDAHHLHHHDEDHHTSQAHPVSFHAAAHSSEVMCELLLVLFGVALFFVIDELCQTSSHHSHHHHITHNANNGVVAPPAATAKQTGKANQTTPTAATKHTSLATAHVHSTNPWLNLVSDATHNLTDGMVIGAMFLASPWDGFRTCIAIAIHEVPHELGDLAMLKQCGWATGRIFLAQLGTAVTNVLGAIGTVLLGQQVESFGAVVAPIVCGTFLYMSLTTIMGDLNQPDANGHRAGVLQRMLQCAAFGCGVGVIIMTGWVETALSGEEGAEPHHHH